ncbi:MAG: D-alanyl-D-alanine carboxypeptidase/D-alanyl-D-alanine-endopeptidase [Ignavibacteria bacterium]|jgi:D-alanyl-D-alanine carboxypeptidase/D-alanyl-D-alanine-endopeptidase (penicillin-binding protein 4)
MKNKSVKYFSILIILFVSTLSFSNNKVSDNIKIFQSRLDSIVATVNCSVSIQIASASKYDLLYAYKPEAKMIPASITKVITSATAFYTLGTNYVFKTVIYSDDNNLNDGIINGNLYIKGYGDPDLSSYDIVQAAKTIIGKNIKSITGNIVYDNSYLDDEYYGLANYYSSDTKITYWPYVCALSLDKNKGSNNPAYSAAKLLADELSSQNIKFDGIVVSGVTPGISKEITSISRSLIDVIYNMNKISDNQSAITVFKVIGANYKSPPGTLKNGSAAVIDFLSSIGVTRSNYEILEGSGLTRYNLVTSDLYMQVLKYMFDDVKNFDSFYASLPVGGIDGTLKDRMQGTEAEKNVHAKTGTINGVSTLTGYAISRDNEPIIFYIAMNGTGTNSKPYRKKQDDICELICKFSRK